MPKIPKGQWTTLSPTKLKNEPEFPEPALEKEPAKVIFARVPMPEGRPRPRVKGGE
jgi:hypothetical protein